MLPYNIKDIAGGALMAALGAYILYTAFGFGIGTATRMGAGYYPMVLGIALIGAGVMIALPAIRLPAARPQLAWGPFISVIAGMGGFALALPRLGLVPAIWVLVGIASLADREMSWGARLGLMAAVSVGAWLLFRLGLGLALPGFRWG